MVSPTFRSVGRSSVWQWSRPTKVKGVEEKLVEWGLRIADSMALWVIAVHPDARKGLYQGLGFEARETYVACVDGDDKKMALARLRRRPASVVKPSST